MWGVERRLGAGVEKVDERNKDVKKEERWKRKGRRGKGEGGVRVPFWGKAAAAFTCTTLPLPFFFSFRRTPTHPEASLKVSRL